MPSECSPKESSLKCYFLAPNAENEDLIREGVADIFEQWFRWRKSAQESDGPFFDAAELTSRRYRQERARLHKELHDLSERFRREVPHHSPRYIGHMYSEYSIPAFFGHLLALMYNPNNISAEVSRVGLDVEHRAIGLLSRMVGYPASARGHFTSGGTVANYEALYRAKIRARTKNNKSDNESILLVPESAHYSWDKGIRLIGDRDSRLIKIQLDQNGRMSVRHLRETLRTLRKKNSSVLSVVSVLGSTELGVMDPVDKIIEVLTEHSRATGERIWHHVDAAYGGFFAATLSSEGGPPQLAKANIQAVRAIRHADSITLDPHKLGYTPYASGCFICRTKKDYLRTAIEAPYLDYKGSADPGPFTIEGSRTAAGPLAILLTARTLGLNKNGLGRVLEKTIGSAKYLLRQLNQSKRFKTLDISGTNIVCFADVGSSRNLQQVNLRTLKLFKKMRQAREKKGREKPYFVSKTTLGAGHNALIERQCQNWNIKQNADQLLLIRCTVMNPFFRTRHSHTNFPKDFVAWANRL